MTCRVGPNPSPHPGTHPLTCAKARCGLATVGPALGLLARMKPPGAAWQLLPPQALRLAIKLATCRASVGAGQGGCISRREKCAWRAVITPNGPWTAGAPVAGDIWPCTLGYVGNSQGIYRATLVYALSLTARARYSASIVAEAGAGLPGRSS